MFSPTDIKKELQNFKLRKSNHKQFVSDLLTSISDTVKQEERIGASLSIGNDQDQNNYNIDLLESDKIFHIDTIKSICIDFRLRFLDTKYFKNDFPEEAIEKIRLLENQHQTKIEGFKIMAPSKLFRLENPDDPLLFAPIGNGYYYLIHKWGNDLSPFRKWLVKPLRNLDNVLISAMCISFVLAYVVNSFLTVKDNNFISNFFLLFLFNFKWVVAVIMFYAIPRGKNVNEAIWDSVYNK
ncbi:hypothetical protein AB9K26_10285 [Psychroserpens sp. XS_ASV72]|uniref:hypothetical protein n=1 Tax=Psychroserpens sp. XS_ASV72 TaxID=3241293 RepID=UPI00351223FD